MSKFDTSQIEELAAAEYPEKPAKVPDCKTQLPGESEEEFQERMKILEAGLE